MADHAILPPSGASRWLTCTPSARLEESYPQTTNTAAEEGTLAHELAELYLRNHFKLIPAVTFKSSLKRIKANPLYDNIMDGHAQDYMSFIVDKFVEMHNPMLFIEEKIDLQDYVPEGFGTGDAIIIADNILDITDLKYGKGVEVSAHENKQLMLYALGAIKKYYLLYDIKLVRMTIYQPRLNNYSTFEMFTDDLIEWGYQEVIPKAQMAWDGIGDYVAGSHCKFCKAKTTCKTLADYNLELAKYAFEDPNKLTDEDISNILEKAADFKSWLTSVQQYALSEAALKQKKWPGFKLVAGRSNRVYVNPEEIVKALNKAKIAKTLFLTEPKLVGIGALEKNIGKSEVNRLLSSYIIKPNGAATLVPEWDKRPALNSHEATIEVFEDISLTDD